MLSLGNATLAGKRATHLSALTLLLNMFHEQTTFLKALCKKKIAFVEFSFIKAILKHFICKMCMLTLKG